MSDIRVAGLSADPPHSTPASTSSSTAVPIRPAPYSDSMTSSSAPLVSRGVYNMAGTSPSSVSVLARAEVENGTRPFRSKKVRPCDGCRKRKNRCAIPIEGEPCIECKQTGRECTFALPPPARQRNKKETPASALVPPQTAPTLRASAESPEPAPSTPAYRVAEPPSASPPIAHPAPVLPVPSPVAAALSSLRDGKRTRAESIVQEEHVAKRRSTPSSTASRDALVSLDRDLPAGVEPCAVTATLTDDLLSHRTVGSSRQISSDRSRSQFILFHARPAHRLSSDEYQHNALRQLRTFLSYAHPDLSELPLLTHYLTYLHPVLPILPISPVHTFDSLPAGLRALLLVTSLSSLPDQQRDSAYAWQQLKQVRLAEQMLEQPKLSSLAAALLELDTNLDPRGDFALLAKTIAHAQLLGLHVDCSAWAIPEWEKSLRERIWWCLRIHDAWASFLNSRPSHIQLGNANVPLPPLPSPDDLDTYASTIAFASFCRLAVVVSRLQAKVSTLDVYGSSKRAEACDEIERELNDMTEEARSFFETARRPPGMDAYCLILLALRCMIRRISLEIRIGLGNAFLPDGHTLDIFARFVQHVSSLEQDSFDGKQPWICYSSHILSSVLSSLIRLSLAAVSAKHNSPPSTANPSQPRTPSPPAPAIQLLAQLCLSLDTAQRTYGWTVADAALSRAASAAERLEAAMQGEGSGEIYREVIAALRRTPRPVADFASPTAIETGGPDGGLHALAALAGGSVGTPGAEPGSWATAYATTEAFNDGNGLSTLTFDFDLPDPNDWLNVLDDAPLWGGDDGSPSNWQLSW
ncbi:hypothetical protein JCM11251_002523 [Rhodosporidiobolus azoricus]